MLPDALALELLTSRGNPELDLSRCVRSRFRLAGCERCVTACPQQAVRCEPLPAVETRACRGCRLCEAACPTGALRGDSEPLEESLLLLRERTDAIWGCRLQGNVHGHVKSACVGFLGMEHLLVLAILLPHGITFNLTHCRQCPNAEAAVQLQQRLEILHHLPNYPFAGRLRLALREPQLNYRPDTISRRAFFQQFRRGAGNSLRQALQRREENGKAKDYGSKRLPVARALLLQALPLLDGPFRRSVETNFFPMLHFTDDCRGCRGCLGICPTGALGRKRHDTSETSPSFEMQLCTACGLCAEFCRRQAIRLTQAAVDPVAGRTITADAS
jgi:ferredoxin